eukprot:1140957-Pelagomonas_calceolata.AAC.1
MQTASKDLLALYAFSLNAIVWIVLSTFSKVAIALSSVTRITYITDWRSIIGPNSLFNSKSVNSQPESGNVLKDMMGKIQIHVFWQSIRRVNGMSISDRECAPLMICQPLTVAYSGIRSCELIPVAKVSSS